jgi:hypothetical protein
MKKINLSSIWCFVLLSVFSCGSNDDSNSENANDDVTRPNLNSNNGNSSGQGGSQSPPSKPSVNPTEKPEPGVQRFSFKHPGVVGKINARILNSRDIYLEPIPNQFNFKLKRDSSASNIEIDNEFCKNIGERLSGFRAMSDLQKNLLEIDLRRDQSQRFFAVSTVIPTNDGRFQNSAFKAAAALFPEVVFAVIVDDVKFVESDVKILADNDALVNALGNLQAVAGQIALENFDYSNGRFSGRVMAHDLLCDIFSGKAKLQFRLKTSSGLEATSISSGVQ